MKKVYLLQLCLLLFVCVGQAQLLHTAPQFAKETDNITITMDANFGNKALLNYSNTNDVYVHIGVITSLSTSSADWKHVPFEWTSNTAQNRATFQNNNKYSFTINNIRSFFNVTGTEVIHHIAILFRSGNGNTVQRNSNSGDMYIKLYGADTLAAGFSQPFMQPLYNAIQEPLSKTLGETLTVNAAANKPSTLNLYLNSTLIQTATAATTITASPVLNTVGNNTLMLQTINGAITLTDHINFNVNSAATILPLPNGVRDGINYNPNNTEATLVLYAPNKNRVCIIGEFAGSNWQENASFQMNKTPDGNYWWKTITGLTPGTEYAFQYLVDGNLKVGEPYTEKVLDPWNDQYINAATYPNLKAYPAGQNGVVSILQTAAPAYNWTVPNFTRPDKRGLMVYELLVRDFIAAHNWQTLKDTLDYLKRIGINAIEILPFNEFDGNESWGYNPAYFFAPDKYYGTKNSLKQFIDVCHTKGMAVVMDIALNHSTGSNPLAQLYWNSATNETAADNPWFNVTARHPYNVFHDFNHEAQPTKYFSKRVIEHWLKEYKIDGYRYDLSKGFTQLNSLGNEGLMAQYDASRVAIWKDYYNAQQAAAAGSYGILEHFADNQEEKELSDYGLMLWGNSNHAFTEASMGYIGGSNFSGGLYTSRGWANPHLVTYMESHDEERVVYKNINFGNASGSYNIKDTTTAIQRAQLAAAFFLAMPGPKLIWQFGEVGYDYSINYCENGTINNDCRTNKKPIRWDYMQQARRYNIYKVYQKMGTLRFTTAYQHVFAAQNTQIEHSLDGAFKWMRLRSANDTSCLVVVGNFGLTQQTQQVSFPVAGNWFNYLDSTFINITGTTQNITLAPGEYIVYLNRNLLNVNTNPVDPEEPEEPEVPEQPEEPGNEVLATVFPNPSRGQQTYIKLHLPASGRVQASIFDASGRPLGTVYDGTLSRGIHNLPVNSRYTHVATGLYWIKVIAGTTTKTVKLVL